MADKEMEILEQVSQETERTKTDILREFIRTLSSGSYAQPQNPPRKLTRADVVRVISCINDAGWFQGYVEEDPTVDELIANYPDLVE